MLVDIGETDFLAPVIRLMNSSMRRVLCFGTAENYDLQVDKSTIIKGSNLSLSSPITPRTHRSQLLNSCDLAILQPILDSAAIVVTGVAAKVQQQVLEISRGKKVMVWDNLKGNDSGEYWRNAHSMLASADVVLFPAQSTISELPVSVHSAKVIGQPALEEWQRAIQSIDTANVLSKLGISPQKRVILYIAGWSGDLECTDGTRLFAAIVQQMFTEPAFQVVVQLHPRSDGDFERGLFAGIARVTTTKECTTEEATSVAEVVVCHKSTAGLKIGAAGRRLIFAVPQEGYQHPSVEAGLATMVKSAEEFATVFSHVTAQHRDFFETLGIPREAAKAIHGFLLA